MRQQTKPSEPAGPLGGIAGETLLTLELLKTHRWATNSQAIEALVLRHVLRGPCRSFARCVKQQQQQMHANFCALCTVVLENPIASTVPGFGCGLARESVGGVGFEVGL